MQKKNHSPLGVSSFGLEVAEDELLRSLMGLTGSYINDKLFVKGVVVVVGDGCCV